MLITVPLALLAAYSLTRYQFRVLSVFLAAVILRPVLPGRRDDHPDLQDGEGGRLCSTPTQSLIIAYITVTLPVAIWMLRGFLMRFPRTLEEAAAIDGAKSVARVLRHRRAARDGRASSRPRFSS